MADLIKVVKDNEYSLISNYHLRDKRLSWSAKGLLSAILAFSGEYTCDELEEMSRNGFKYIEGFAELEVNGYLTWKQCGIESIDGYPVIEYMIYEKPINNRSAQNPVAEVMDPEDMPMKYSFDEFSNIKKSPVIDEAEKQKLEKQLRIDDLVKNPSKGDAFYICIVEVAFHELCKRDADFRNKMTAIAFKKVCDTVSEWQFQHMARGAVLQIINSINKAFNNIQEAQKTSRKQQKGTLERDSGKV